MKKFILSIVLFCACAYSASAWFGDSFVTINGILYRGSRGYYDDCPIEFNNANLGIFTSSFKLGGEIQHHDKTNEDAEIWYIFDENTLSATTAAKGATLPRDGDYGNNSMHKNHLGSTISISNLSEGSHTITVWFKMGDNQYEDATYHNYKANFIVSHVGRDNETTQLSENLVLNDELSISTSSQIVSNDKTTTANKISIKHTVAATNQWEFISLPFAVTAIKGTDGASLTQSDDDGDYGLAIYNGTNRANTGAGWSYYPTTPLSAGAYAIWVDGSKVSDLTVVFETSATSTGVASYNAANGVSLAYPTGTAHLSHYGWHFVNHPLLSHANIVLGVGQFLYPYDNITNTFGQPIDNAPYTSNAFSAYFIKTAAVGSLNYTSTTYSPVSAASTASIEKLTLLLNDTYSTTIRIKEFSTNDYDDLYDAPYMSPMSQSVPQIYTLNNAGKMAINSIPESTTIPLGFRFANPGEYTLTWDNQLVSSNVTLIDNLGETIDMSLSPSYTFTVGATGEINNRFSIGINRVTTGLIQTQGDVKVYTENNTIVVSGLNKTAAVHVYDLAGRTIANETVASSFRIPVQKGIYLVTVGEKRFKLVNQ